MIHTVEVHGHRCKVSVYQKSKSIWEATGSIPHASTLPDAPEKEITGRGRSESSALNNWRQSAEYWSN